MALPWDPDLLRTPLFGVLADVLEALPWAPGRWPTLGDYQALFDALPLPPASGGGAPLRVVAPKVGGRGWEAGYEPRIYRKGELQTRPENWHDLFNVLAWAVFPHTKAAINRRHYELQAARAADRQTGRGPAEDALTQFDESGVVIACADPTLGDLLRGFRWKELFWAKRAQLPGHMACYLFGHGLMEKALQPYLGMTGKGVVIPVEPGFFSRPLVERLACLDAAVAQVVARLGRPAELQPVPVLGFPGFAAENDSEAYYDNHDYFRPRRRGRPSDSARQPT